MSSKVTLYRKGNYIRSLDGEKLFRLEEPLAVKWRSGDENLLIGKAYDMKMEQTCFVKVTNDAGSLWAGLQREVRFKFYYPYIEHTYGKFSGLAPDGTEIYGVSVEFIEGKNLTETRIELHDAVKSGVLSEEEEEKIVFRQMLEMLLGMECYMEQTMAPSLHRDIKSDNVMIIQDLEKDGNFIPGSGHVKIVDFDSSHASNSYATIKALMKKSEKRKPEGPELGGTYGFISPRAVLLARAKGKTPDKIDEIYSAGRLFFFWLNDGQMYYREEDIKDEKYIISGDRELGYGIDKERFVSGSRYIDSKTGEFREKYKGLIKILEKMCCDPEQEEPYRSPTEIIEDFLKFLEAYYGSDKYEEYMGLKELPLLWAGRRKRTRKNGNTVPVYLTVPDDPGAGVRGKNLYEYCMRNIEIDGQTGMVIYNIGGCIYYIPMNGTKFVSGHKNEEYRIYDKDIFCNEKGAKIQFLIG